MIFEFSNKNDAESSINFVKIPFLNPKRAKLDQNSHFSHVRTCQDLSRRTSTYCKPAEIFLFFEIFEVEKACFSASPAKSMQNHLEISSKNIFGTRSVHNWTTSRKSDMSGQVVYCPTSRLLSYKSVAVL